MPPVLQFIFSFLSRSSWIAIGTALACWAVSGDCRLWGQEKPAAGDAAGSQGVLRKMALGSGTGIVIGGPGCPIAVCGGEVWQLVQGKKVLKLDAFPDFLVSTNQQLSGDGRCVAMTNDQDNSVQVWSCESGKKMLSVPAGNKTLECLRIVKNKFLVVGRAEADELEIWSVDGGHLRNVPLPVKRLGDVRKENAAEVKPAAGPSSTPAPRQPHVSKSGKSSPEASKAHRDAERRRAESEQKREERKKAAEESRKEAEEKMREADQQVVGHVDKKSIVFSADGRYFACFMEPEVIVCESSGKKLASMRIPTQELKFGPAAAEEASAKDREETRTVSRPVTFSQLAFSPDGSELAGLSDFPHDVRIVCWGLDGKLTFDSVIVAPREFLHTTFEWLPDGSGWLLNNCLVDRRAKHVLATVPAESMNKLSLISQDEIVGVFGDASDEIHVLAIPWRRIKASVAELTGSAPALVRPRQAVSLKIDVKDCRGDEAETRATLAKLLKARLAKDSIRVGEGQSVVLHLTLTESAGEKLQIREMGSGIGARDRDTGRFATEAKGAVDLELRAEGRAKAIWTGKFNVISSHSLEGDVNDGALQKNMIQNIGERLDQLLPPYYVPVSGENVNLPALLP
jgi:WD40 repeat protein